MFNRNITVQLIHKNRLTIIPAYSSFSSYLSWSQTNSSCPRTTEKSLLLNSGRVVWETQNAMLAMNSHQSGNQMKARTRFLSIGPSSSHVGAHAPQAFIISMR